MDVFRSYTDTHFEPDYGNSLKPVIDFLAERPEVDMAGLAILGISVGGYFVTRATTHEPRTKALIANSPVLKWERGVKNESWHDSAKR
jgi:dipeptidyl aminopeptidase/acylaminoacyl peptidase